VNVNTNARQVGISLAAVTPAIDVAMSKSVKRHGQLLLSSIRGHASGRPGPRAPTGDYRRSWGLQISRGPASTVATVGTNAPQGRRLELGFVGADSLGRVYDQPPFPHAEPAMAEIGPRFVADVTRIVFGFTAG